MDSKGGLKSLAIGRGDQFKIDPRTIVVEPGFNSRDFSMRENVEYVDSLKPSIKQHGVKMPLTVRLKDGAPWLVDGECRLRAVMALISEGVEIPSVPCQSEGPGVNEATRIVEQHIRNTGKRFAPLELARHCRRLIGLGFDQARIAEEMVITPSYVSQLLSMLEMPEAAQEAVKAGSIAASTAATIIREHGEVNGVAVIQAAVEEKRAAEPPPRHDIAKQVEILGADSLLPPEKPARKPAKRVTIGAARKAAAKVTGKRIGPKLTAVHVEKIGSFFSYIGRARSLEAVKDEADKVFKEVFGSV